MELERKGRVMEASPLVWILPVVYVMFGGIAGAVPKFIPKLPALAFAGLGFLFAAPLEFT